MEDPPKQLSNSYSTGGGGPHFETHVQAMFVTLMLAGGFVPTMPSWPIKEIKLQNKIRGYHTDDLLVVIEEPISKGTAKLIAQIKRTIRITKAGPTFRDVIQDAWRDYSNQSHFDKSIDNIALITGPLSAPDTTDVPWLLNQARHTTNSEEFFTKVNETNFSSASKRAKLSAFQAHLDISEEELHSFLKRFHLLVCDLGTDAGTMLPLLNSLISQFDVVGPESVWGRIVDLVQTWNQDAGTITVDSLPRDLTNAFSKMRETVVPSELVTVEMSNVDSIALPTKDIPGLLAANLVGAWNDKKEADLEVIRRLMARSGR